MKRAISKEIVQYCLENLSEQNALCFHDHMGTITIPYLMNDAIECYIVLEKVHITGVFKNEPGKKVGINVIEDGDRRAIIVRDHKDQVFTIWYEGKAWLESDCFKYHNIMHYWREGNPHLRRLVGIIKAISDKRTIIGEYVCNEEELSLSELIYFAPFRYYSPYSYSLTQLYPNCESGAREMLKIAYEAGDQEYAREVQRYIDEPNTKKENKLTELLQKQEHEKIYKLIDEKIRIASLPYKDRRYNGEEELSCAIKRLGTERYLEKMGYIGEYPRYVKGKTSITVYEEQPYTRKEDRQLNFQMILLKEKHHGKTVDRSIERIIYPDKIEEMIGFGVE